MWRRIIFSLLSILVVGAIVLAVWYFVGQSQGDEAILFPQEGSVTVKRRFNTISLSPPEVLKVGEGDEIETGADSRALIVLLSGASVRLESHSNVILRKLSLPEDAPPIIELEMQWGDTWHELSSSIDGETRYEILTPSARVRLFAERHHVTVSDDGSTQVEAQHGWAMVKAQSTEVEVRPGEYTSVPVGRAPAVSRPMVARFLRVSQSKGNSDIWLLDEEGKEFQLTDSWADDLAPAWSPDGSRIAFETLRDGNSEIYVMNSDGSGQVNLTNNPAPDHAPIWSADGTKIAFESLRDGGRDIYLMNADGSEQTKLTYGPGLNFAPSWSAENPGVVFTKIEQDTNGDGTIDLADMGNFFFVDDKDGAVQAVWDRKMIFEQVMFPWGRRLIG